MSKISSGICPVRIGCEYRVTDTTRRSTETSTIRVTWCEERKDKWYFGYVPTRDSIRTHGSFGATAISKPGFETAYGITECVPLDDAGYITPEAYEACANEFIGMATALKEGRCTLHEAVAAVGAIEARIRGTMIRPGSTDPITGLQFPTKEEIAKIDQFLEGVQ